MNKNELLSAMSDSYAKLNEQIGKMTDDELNAPFQFANDPKKCGARWIYDQCSRDLLIHLYEWQVLMREFVKNIREGHPKDYLPDEYGVVYTELGAAALNAGDYDTAIESYEKILEHNKNQTMAFARMISRQLMVMAVFGTASMVGNHPSPYC